MVRLRLITLYHCLKSIQIRSFFLVRIFPHSDWIRSISPYSVRMRKIRTRKNSVFGHFARSVYHCVYALSHLFSCFYLISLENTRKPLAFCCFQGISNGNIGQKWVNLKQICKVLPNPIPSSLRHCLKIE